ncbi:hypothetical protein [Streptomyces naphthomycinicus]|uniref:hypothetical protein n=1 Tax=Streptomyces naphthomycinicus TaxID=2872625 RepID=UPI001CED8649|nr:hypothetical protein [Streptomyces sp. TML10]
MSLADLALAQWRSLDLPSARRIGRQAADLVDGRLVSVEDGEHLGARLCRVRIERGGRDFALIPGGDVTLGFDPAAWTPTPEQIADCAVSLEQELTDDVTAVHGGDGGEAECGGYGTFLSWLPLATANRNPSMAEFVYGSDGEDLADDISVRPVLPL